MILLSFEGEDSDRAPKQALIANRLYRAKFVDTGTEKWLV